MLIRIEGGTRVISTEDSLSEIAVFPGEGDTFVVEQDTGVAGIHQTSFTRQEMFELGALFINLANNTA